MPQLVKGGKYIFGWTRIIEGNKIKIPDEAYEEYNIASTDKLFILSGSNSSGGFSIITPNSIINSKLSIEIIRLAGYDKETNSFSKNRLEIIKHGKRFISWTNLEAEKYFKISNELISMLKINIGDNLLVGRGSGLGPAFIVKGTIYEEALKHDIMQFN